MVRQLDWMIVVGPFQLCWRNSAVETPALTALEDTMQWEDQWQCSVCSPKHY